MRKHERVIETATGVEPTWENEVDKLDDEGITLTLTRGDESMQITWDGRGSLVHPLVYTLSGIKEVKLRNVAAALRVIADKPNYTRRVGVRRERQAPAVPENVPLPFDIELATDEEIIKAVRGKKLTWLNEMAGEYETGMVPDAKRVEVPDGNGGRKFVRRTSRNITMSVSSEGRRILTFPAVNEQYRSLHLDRLVQIK